MSEYKPYKPTDEEAEVINRAAFVVAWNALQPLRDEDLDISLGVLACLKAFRAATEAKESAEKALLATKPDFNSVSHYVDETAYVCSAILGLDADDSSELHPISIGGERIRMLLKAVIALEAISSVYSALDNEVCVSGACYANETIKLAEALDS